MYYEILWLYLLIINGISFLFCVYDKFAAKKQLSRISEKTLLWLSVLGGSVTMYVTMKLIRHKTLHKKFMVGIPVIIVFQVVLVLFFVFGIDKLM